MKICPQCRKASSISETLQFTKCGYCGSLLRARTEKRGHLRIAAHYDSTILAGKDVYYGQCVDISLEGFRIAYNGKALDKGIRIDIALDNINVKEKTEVVWSQQYSAHTAHIGVRII